MSYCYQHKYGILYPPTNSEIFRCPHCDVQSIQSENATLKAQVKRQDGPEWTCKECGCMDHEKFRDVKHESMDGVEYDVECPNCGSYDVEESPSAALSEVINNLDEYRAKSEVLEDQVKRLREALLWIAEKGL